MHDRLKGKDIWQASCLPVPLRHVLARMRRAIEQSLIEAHAAFTVSSVHQQVMDAV